MSSFDSFEASAEFLGMFIATIYSFLNRWLLVSPQIQQYEVSMINSWSYQELLLPHTYPVETMTGSLISSKEIGQWKSFGTTIVSDLTVLHGLLGLVSVTPITFQASHLDLSLTFENSKISSWRSWSPWLVLSDFPDTVDDPGLNSSPCVRDSVW